MDETRADTGDDEAGYGGWLIRLTRGARSELEVFPLNPGPPPQQATIGESRCVFAGILYDRDELIRACGLDVAPESNDAAVILQAHLRVGQSLIERMKGTYAAALWDGETLLCVRDRLGIYPLFSTCASGDLFVSTSIDSLLAQPGVPDAVNLAVLVDHLRHRWLYPEETFFEAVRRIPAGHWLRSTGGVQTVGRYWDPVPADESFHWIGADEIYRFEFLLQRAVDRCVRNEATGIFLSGGLDSVTIAALAAGKEPRPLALSLAFPDPSCNEEEVQRRVAAQLGLAQVMVPWNDAVGERGIVSAALELSVEVTAPLINLWAPAYDRLASMGRDRGCRVILTGSGGDEWLGVTPYYAADLMRRLDVVGFVQLFDNLRRSFPLPVHRHLMQLLWPFGLRPLARRGAIAAIPGAFRARKQRAIPTAIPAWLAPDDQLRRQIIERELDVYSRSLTPLRRRSRSHPAVYIEEIQASLDHPLVSMESEELFEQGRRVGVALLHPFMDSDLVEFLCRTPPELLNQGGRSKGLVRGILARRLPGFGFETQRKVVATNFGHQVVAQESLPAWRQYGGVPSLTEVGAVDEARIQELLEAASGSSMSDRLRLWDLLSSDVWFRRKRGGAREWAKTHGSP